MAEKIVVTGYGIISSLGIGVDKTKEALLKEERSIGKVFHLQTEHTDIPCGEVKESDDELRKHLGIAGDYIVTRTPLLAMTAFKEALQTSGITDSTNTAFINGTTVGGMEKSELYYNEFFNGKHTEYITAHDCGAGTEQVGQLFGHFSFMTTISTACSSAANSIILGADLIKAGKVDAAIVGGTESLSKFHLNGFNSLMILEHEACRPFDKNNQGLNLGEGAAFLVIEKESNAQKRGAHILCELAGYANTCDAFHQTATSAESTGAYLAMSKALQNAGLNATDIDYINAHGTGTEDNDIHESIALKRVFGENIPPFSSTKSYTGHTTSAAGAVESVISIIALLNNFMPANIGFSEPIAATGLRPIVHTTKKQLNTIMTNSFGFGGNDSSCIFSKYQVS